MDSFQVQLRAIRYEAEGISSFELWPVGMPALPAFTAGAHIDLRLAPGLIRSYSLCNSQDERHRYLIAVNRNPSSRGGSRHVHEALRVGDTLDITAPRNNFVLNQGARRSLLIAGGIGITPLLSMARRLTSIGRDWELSYCVRSRARAAFLDELRALADSAGARLHLHFDDVAEGVPDLAGLVARSAEDTDTHFYCCGPLPMLAAFESATAEVAADRVHVEYFSAREQPAAAGGFVVTLARSGRSVAVAEGQTILEALLDAGVEVPYSCMQGICASCETRVLEGVPDHHDLVLSKEEQSSNTVMMICCSGSRTPALVLDL